MLNFILGYCLLKISIYICITLILKLKIMTIEQFDKARWGASTKVIYEGNILNVGSVCFQEKLIGVYDINDQSRNNDCNCGQYDWIRCENAELIKPI